MYSSTAAGRDDDEQQLYNGTVIVSLSFFLCHVKMSNM